MTPSELAQVRECVAQGLLKEAIALLRQHLPDSEEVTTVSNGYALLQRRQGEMSPQEILREEHKISRQIQALLDRLNNPVQIAPPTAPENQGKVVSAGARNIAKMIGRDQELKAIAQQFAQGERLLLLLNGIGGVGKTTLARAYFNEYAAQYAHRFWVVFRQDLQNTLVQGLNHLPDLGFEGDLGQIFAQVHHHLANLPGRKLLVIDNFDEANEARALQQILPSFDILVTSRLGLGASVACLPVGVLSPAHSKALFYAHYEGKADDAALEELLQHIGRHTLTTELLAKTASVGELAIAELLEIWQKEGINAPDLELDILTHYDQAQASEAHLQQILQAAFDLAALTPAEQDLLRQFALMPPATALPTATLQTLLQIDQKNDLLKLLNALAKKGWLERLRPQAEGQAWVQWKAHPIIQTTLRAYLPPRHAHHQALVEQIIDLLHIDPSKDNPVDKFAWLPWGQHLLDYLPDLPPATQSALQNNLAGVYWILGGYDKALDLFETALVNDLENFGAKHPIVATRQNNLASVYQDLGEYGKALDLFETALASGLENFGAKHPEVATRQNNLARVYQDLGEYGKALDLFKTALASALENFGAKHPTVATFQNNLGLVYKDLREYGKALDLLEAALASNLENFGAKHPTVARGQNNLAMVYKALGESDKALDLYETALATVLESFGAKHPTVATFQNNLGLVYQTLGEYGKALDLLEAALASDLENFGAKHPTVTISQSNLATMYQGLGEYDKARALWQEAYATFLETLGEGHPYTQMARKWLEGLEGR